MPIFNIHKCWQPRRILNQTKKARQKKNIVDADESKHADNMILVNTKALSYLYGWDNQLLRVCVWVCMYKGLPILYSFERKHCFFMVNRIVVCGSRHFIGHLYSNAFLSLLFFLFLSAESFSLILSHSFQNKSISKCDAMCTAHCVASKYESTYNWVLDLHTKSHFT